MPAPWTAGQTSTALAARSTFCSQGGRRCLTDVCRFGPVPGRQHVLMVVRHDRLPELPGSDLLAANHIGQHQKRTAPGGRQQPGNGQGLLHPVAKGFRLA